MKIRNKIILLLFLTFSFFTVTLGAVLYLGFSQYSFTDFYHRLEIRARATARLELGGRPAEIESFKKEHLQPLDNETDYVFDVGPALGEVSAAKGMNPAFITEIQQNGMAFFRKDNTFYAGILHATAVKKHIVVVSADNYFDSHHMAYMRNLLIFGSAIALLVLAAISTLLTRTLVQPLREIAAKARHISSENLHLRLELPDSKDELGDVAATMNEMLDRLETAFESQKNFISNASHELRTPLTAIIGEADVVLSRDRSPDEYRRSIATIQGEAEKLHRKTQAILALAQTGLVRDQRHFTLVRTDELVVDVCRSTRLLYPDADIRVDFSLLPEAAEKLKTRGNKQLLHIALSNVLANACKYSTSQIKVALASTGQNIIIVVEDSGIGIPEHELQHIYDPFFRASNVRHLEGYGIGLPLSRNILRMHRGSIVLQSQVSRGTVVQISLPAAEGILPQNVNF